MARLQPSEVGPSRRMPWGETMSLRAAILVAVALRENGLGQVGQRTAGGLIERVGLPKELLGLFVIVLQAPDVSQLEHDCRVLGCLLQLPLE